MPILPGSDGPVDNEEKALKVAKEIGYPVIIKATAGGGGRGMRVVRDAGGAVARGQDRAARGRGGVRRAATSTSRSTSSRRATSSSRSSATTTATSSISASASARSSAATRSCIEESPSPALSEKLRRKMGGIVIDAAKAVQYTNAGTFEFLMDPDGRFYFMEVNTRLQVEHPVTEMVTGIDIVKEQIRIAAGERLSFKQSDVTFTGHSIECRINAEDPETFVPSPGHHPRVQRAGRPRRARRDVRALRLHDLAVLRFDDRQDHRPRPRPAGSDRPHEAHARDDGHRRHQDDHPAAPAASSTIPTSSPAS